MKEELILKILDRSSEFMADEQIQKLRAVLSSELYEYDVQPTVKALVPVNKAPEMLKLYLASKKLDGIANSTLKNYHRQLAKFLMCVQKNVEEINSMDCRVYLAGYSSAGVKNSTLNTISAVLKSFFGWLVNNDYIHKNPMNVIKNCKTSKFVRKALTSEELELLRDACRTERESAIVEFFYSTGARLDEVQKLSKSDLDFNSKSLFVFGKGSKERKTFLTPSAILKLKNYFKLRTDNNEAIFVSERNPHNRLGRRAIQKIFSELGKRAGIKKNVYPHLLRHTTATLMLRRGASMAEVQKLLGHESSSTTQIYAQLDTQALQISHERNIA